MKRFENSDWLVLNSLIYKIYTTRDFELMRSEFLEQLRLLLAGESNDQICEELCISVNTLKKHVLNLYRKLGIRNRVQMFKMIREKE